MEDNVKNKGKEETKKNNKILKKVLTILLFVVILIVIVAIGMFSYKVIVVKKIMDNNVDVYLGNNYKIIKTFKDGNETKEEIIYYKDGIAKQSAANGKNCILRDENSVYIYSMDEMKYYDLGNETIGVNLNENYNLLMNVMLSKEDVDSISKIIKLITDYGFSVGKNEVDGKEYIVLSINDDAFDIYINKDTYICEMCQGETQKVEVGTVTDEDMKRPWELGLTKGETNN